MHWNHRILKFKHGYELCEVYYNEDGEPYLYGPAKAMGDTPEEVQEVLNQMVRAAAKPIVTKWEKSKL